jgi:hypothetical protein
MASRSRFLENVPESILEPVELVEAPPSNELPAPDALPDSEKSEALPAPDDDAPPPPNTPSEPDDGLPF